jgi:microcystin-dependent protein
MMNHEPRDEQRNVDRRGFLGIGAIAAGGIGAASLGSGFTSEALTDPFLGEILAIPYNFAPRGFAFCEGQMLPVSQNQALFSLLGDRFGGDRRTTFGLPDTRPVEEEMRRATRSRVPPFRYVIALQGTFPSRN